MFKFKVIKKEGKTKARNGLLETPHGVIRTPAFVPVSTKGALRGVDYETAYNFGSDIFMVNAFHFFCNKRHKEVKKFGGLHKFANINYPLMTDSGGFQVFSYGFGREHEVGKISEVSTPQKEKKSSPRNKNLVKISSDGVEFSLPTSGEKVFMNPKVSMEVQKNLGADLIFAFDECTSSFADYNYTKEALQRTNRWAEESLSCFGRSKKQALMGVVQGGEFQDLREESAKFTASLPFFGFGIGGFLGKSKKDMYHLLDWVNDILPEEKPRHLLGIGEVDDILESVEKGVDLFDCVVPTRWARHGTALTSQGRLNIKGRKYLNSKKPIDKNCSCPICKNHSVGYVSHLIREKEIFGAMLLTHHNLFWIQNLMASIREEIKKENFSTFKNKLLKKYGTK
ncbi:MAG: tRNA guanosine(34) transglycosylase Tgt [Candidatus Pacebacteria bacterium]|nr:tRNA guanosine(34) transglycosylase Tgt [Candidatus Paceibacterota bacterium]